MARTFAKTHLSIWINDEFRDLSVPAQWLYWHLFSHPDLSWCGVVRWEPDIIAGHAAALPLEAVLAAADELGAGHFIAIDERFHEVLVRSFIRNDELLKQKNMGAAIGKAFIHINSGRLRGIVVHELRRLHAEHPDWTSWPALEDVLSKPSVSPYDSPSLIPS